ncbi:unnamed protein product [Lathyrus sativus]|nr:unnamed protein product [Lathyrus sativus]
MERREECVKKMEEGLMVEKKKLVAGKKRGIIGRSSTPSPTWRLQFPSSQHNVQQEFLNSPTSKTLSARNLCAKLWEFHSHHQPGSARDSRRCVQASFGQPRRSVDRNGSAVQSVSASPASYRRSLEVMPENDVNPRSSLGQSSCNSKSSRELVKVLDRMRCLEEQHASNIATAKALINELDFSQAQVKELVQEKKMNRKIVESLMKQITEDKRVNEVKERDMIKDVIQSVKEEIEDERRLRKSLENRYRSLTKELSEVKSLFRASLRDLGREKKTNILLENLCDDFAKGVRDYEHEVRSVTHNANKNHIKDDSSLDRLILHISEAWLDERTQMKLLHDSRDNDLPQTHSIVDKLHVDIETFRRAKQSIDSSKHSNSSTKKVKEIYPCLYSLDSFKLKETITSPQSFSKEASIGTGIFEDKTNAEKGLNKLNAVKNMSCEIGRYSSTLLNAPSSRVSKFWETKQGVPESDGATTKRINLSQSLVGNSSMSSEGDKVYPESICREDSCVHSAVTVKGSPVKQWKTTCARGVKDNTFMAKLIEARLEGHKSQSNTRKSSF